MKKMLFYITNALVCTMFLCVRLMFSIFVVQKEFLTVFQLEMLDLFTTILIFTL